MQQFKQILSLRTHLEDFRKKDKRIGFVPTMGALHPGHLALIEEAKKNCDLVVCSIFVNPTQFNDPKDLLKYPRQLKEDVLLLEGAGCDVLFAPEVDELYDEKTKNFRHNFGTLETILEGKFRKGHYQGVGQIVHRLFSIVEPTQAFFGMKDYQQYLLIKKLVQDFKMRIDVLACSTIRESNGLAMSSPNTLLSDNEKQKAALLFQSLLFCKNHVLDYKPSDLEAAALNILATESLIIPEYFEIRRADNLEKPNNTLGNHQDIIALLAVRIGNVRLIDNMLLND